jgi:prophage tail gpP-like protein
MPDVRLRVNGLDYGGWTRVNVVRSLEAIAGTFELRVTERWPQSGGRIPIQSGQYCAVLIDGAPVITGHVDDVEPRYDALHHEVTVRGRDATGDLVDCAARNDPGWWTSIGIVKLAKALCEPFGVPVILGPDLGADPGDYAFGFGLEAGESVFEALERLARIQAVLLMSDGKGSLVITRAGTRRLERTVLQRGLNILAMDATASMKGRFSEYFVYGPAELTLTTLPEPTPDLREGKAVDSLVPRHRPRIVLAEKMGSNDTFAKRAQWELAVRRARGTRLVVTVQGWAHAEGLWEPNVLVHVDDDWVGVQADMLVAQAAYLLDEEGTRAELTLVPPDAYSLIPTIPFPEL